MMKKLTLVLFIIISVNTFAQQHDLDHLMRTRFVRCPDVYLNSLALIPEYYRKGQIDSVKIVIDYWKTKCGPSEPATRMAILLSLKEKTFREDSLYEPVTGDTHFNQWHDRRYYFARSWKIFGLLERYRRHLDELDYTGAWGFDPSYVEYIQVQKAFNFFTQNIALEIGIQYDKESLEFMICKAYMNDFEPLYSALQTDRFAHTNIKKEYDAALKSARAIGDVHFAFFSGLWMPQGGLSVMGTHPYASVIYGFSKGKLLIDGILSFAFMRAANNYTVYDKYGTRHDSDYFVGLYYAIEPSYLISAKKRSKLYAAGGLGFDRITVVTMDEKIDRDAVFITTPAFNAGLTYRFFKQNGVGYYGFDARYHWLGYDTRGGTNLDGNAIAVRLILGGMSNNREVALRRLYYKRF